MSTIASNSYRIVAGGSAGCGSGPLPARDRAYVGTPPGHRNARSAPRQGRASPCLPSFLHVLATLPPFVAATDALQSPHWHAAATLCARPVVFAHRSLARSSMPGGRGGPDGRGQPRCSTARGRHVSGPRRAAAPLRLFPFSHFRHPVGLKNHSGGVEKEPSSGGLRR